MKKTIWKIRLRQDGTWEHVYFNGEEKKIENAKEIAMLEEIKRLEEFKEYLIEAALEVKGFAEANTVIHRVKNKT